MLSSEGGALRMKRLAATDLHFVLVRNHMHLSTMFLSLLSTCTNQTSSLRVEVAKMLAQLLALKACCSFLMRADHVQVCWYVA
eukprot:3290145-Amphidinium_carterae.1